MAKKAPATKTPAKRKPRAKKPVDVSAEFGQITAADLERAAASLKRPSSLKPIAWRSRLVSGAKAAAWIVCGAVAGVWVSGGIEVGPGPFVRNDVLQQSYDADRITQAAVLRDYAAKGFANDDAGREAATKWFNENRFRNRGPDFRPYTSAVTDHFAAGTLAKFADELEGK
jgi:hypothetical protein